MARSKGVLYLNLGLKVLMKISIKSNNPMKNQNQNQQVFELEDLKTEQI